METFSIKINKTDRRDEAIYCEWIPENGELADKVMHAMTLDIAGTIAETIVAYESIAATEMFLVIDRIFPGAYQLDPQYS